MDGQKYLLLINGQDKTDSVASYRFQDDLCEVVYLPRTPEISTTQIKTDLGH